jgi:chemotaxis protein methyltransferase CheR
MSPDTFAFVAELVGRRSAIRLDAGKEYLVESRLNPLARAQGLDLDGYVRWLRSAADEADLAAVVEAMTTNETSFFRDVAPFAALRPHVLPLLRQAGAAGRLRVWSAACSTGQEPYSILMALADVPAVPVDIVATDLNEQVLERARAGEYSQLEVNRGLPATALVRYFERVGPHWRVRPELRAQVQFRRHNLLDPPPAGPFDMVFCRNVLIYFDLATKRAVLDRIARVLRPGGFLVLGAAETTLGIHDGFERVEAGGAVLHRPLPTPGLPPVPAGVLPTQVGLPPGSPFALPVPPPPPPPLPVVPAFAAPTAPASELPPHQRGLS